MLELHHEPRLNKNKKLHQLSEFRDFLKFKKKKSFSSAYSRGPAPKLQITKVLPSEYMAIAHTGSSCGPTHPGFHIVAF